MRKFEFKRGGKADRAMDTITGALYAAMCRLPADPKPKDGSK